MFGFAWQPAAFGDVDDDGDVDIVVNRRRIQYPATTPLEPSIWVNDGSGGFREHRHLLPLDAMAPRFQFVDYDHDGDLDLIASSEPFGLILLTNDGTGRFLDESQRRLGGFPIAVPRQFCLIDIDHDGDKDILIDDAYTNMVLYLNDGSGNFHGIQQQLMFNSASGPHPIDVDGDGWEDVLMLNNTQLYLTRPGQTSMLPGNHLLPSTSTPLTTQNLQIADFDLDGDLDLIAKIAGGNGLICYWENTGNGFVDRSATMPIYPLTSNYAGFLADFDLDGDLDVAFGMTGPTTQHYLSNTYREAVTVVPPTRGGPYTVDFYAQANHLMLVAFGIGEGNLGLPGFGRWYLDPNLTTLVGVLPFPTRSKQALSVTIPNLPALQGLRVAMQALDIDLATGKAQTTNAPFSTIP
jgi:hypothetical protein